MKQPGIYMERAANRDYSKSWQIPGIFPRIFQKPKPEIIGRPISVRENYLRCVKGEEPYWMPAYFYESNTVWPDALEEHPIPEVDGFDWWGVDWKMVEDIQGMITKPGTRVINDFENWENDVEWPDLSLVDFQADGEKIRKAYDPDRPHIYESVEGLTERLHEMMPFDEFLLTFYEEPEALERFLKKMADYKIECCRQVFDNYGRVDGVLYHDDWGTQRSGFFSNEMFRKQIMPQTERLFDYIRGEGKFIELHSCGKNIQYVPMMLEMGIDMWTPQDCINEPDMLNQKYGKEMTFTFALPLKSSDTEDEIRNKVRDFVDRYGENGRVMCWIKSENPVTDSALEEIARDELYRYSKIYYDRLYGRSEEAK